MCITYTGACKYETPLNEEYYITYYIKQKEKKHIWI
jgi:hypothetical protein